MSRLRSLAVALAFVTSSCSASYPAAPDPTTIAVQVFYVRAMSYAAVGWTYAFAAYATRSDGAYEDVTRTATWTSSDSGVLRPETTSGFFTAVAVGPVEVTVRYQSAVGALSIPVIRTDRLIYPRLSISGGDPRIPGVKTSVSLSLQHSATSSESVTNLAAWTSGNPSVVTIEGGSVKAVGVGTTLISATYNGLTVVSGLSVHPQT